MLYTKFQAAEAGEQVFKYILLANPGCSGIGPF